MRHVSQVVVGCKVKVTKAKNKTLEGIEGQVIEETRNMLILETRKGIKKLIKNQIEFKVENGKKQNWRKG